MKTLHLNLKGHWFDMIFRLEKQEEYREIKPYWCARLLLVNGIKRDMKYWKSFFIGIKNPVTTIKNLVFNKQITFIEFETITFSNGMTPPVPRFEIKNLGIRISGGSESWGAEKGQIYFNITLGYNIKEIQ